MYKFDLSKILTDVEELLNDDLIPFMYGNACIGGNDNLSHNYSIRISKNATSNDLRVILLSYRYSIVMFQMSEPEIMQYVISNTLASSGVRIDSTEEHMFQQSLTDVHMCTYDDLQRMIRITQEGLDVGTDYLQLPRVTIC